jgi:hypothetical protein
MAPLMASKSHRALGSSASHQLARKIISARSEEFASAGKTAMAQDQLQEKGEITMGGLANIRKPSTHPVPTLLG